MSLVDVRRLPYEAHVQAGMFHGFTWLFGTYVSVTPLRLVTGYESLSLGGVCDPVRLARLECGLHMYVRTSSSTYGSRT
jgi:hypothetical protein